MTKILVIEDETILRQEIVEWLTLEGYDALGAENGVVGVELAFRHIPDLIISDITMPLLDGYGVLLELQSNAKTANIPFIFVTARASYDDVRTGMNLGADDYITKPFTRLQLLEAVSIRLDKKYLQEKKHQYELEQWKMALNEEREQRLLKARLMGMFSHDFRNPLASILASSSIIRNYEDRLTPERKVHHLDQIDGSVHLLLQMLDDMLIVAEMENGRLEFRPEPIDLRHFMKRIIEEFQLIHNKTHLIIFESNFDNIVAVDPKLFRQIVTNLISNAIKYSPAGSEVLISLAENNGSIELLVADQGMGISEDDREHLFEAFYRAENAKNMKGTGLGLSIVKYALDLHGGTIDILNNEAGGTTFSIKLATTPIREGR